MLACDSQNAATVYGKDDCKFDIVTVFATFLATLTIDI
jgi:hypothetical protein